MQRIGRSSPFYVAIFGFLIRWLSARLIHLDRPNLLQLKSRIYPKPSQLPPIAPHIPMRGEAHNQHLVAIYLCFISQIPQNGVDIGDGLPKVSFICRPPVLEDLGHLTRFQGECCRKRIDPKLGSAGKWGSYLRGRMKSQG